MKFITLIFLLSIFIFNDAKSKEGIILKSPNETFKLGKRLQFYEDKTGKLKLEDILNINEKFKYSDNEAPTFGLTKSAIWGKVIITNNSNARDWVIKNNIVWHDYFNFYKKNGDEWTEIKTGDRRPFNTRDINYRGFAFHIKPQKKSIYYFRISGNDDISLAMELISLNQFTKNEGDVLVGYALFYGAILIMVFYNLTNYFFIKEKSYLYYCLTILSLLWLNVGANGLAFQYIYPNSIWIQNDGFFLRAGLTIFFFNLFVKSFLQIEKARFLYKIIQFNLVCALIIMFCSFLNLYNLIYPPVIIFSISAFIFIIYAGVVRMWEGYKPARYYILAFSGFSIGGIVQTLSIAGLIAPTWFVNHGFQFGNLFQTFFLAFALGDKFRLMKEEALQKETEAKKVLEGFSLKLKKEVEAQTVELREKNERLKEYDYTVAHDLINPIGVALSYVDLYDKLYKDNPEKTQEVMKNIKTSIEKSVGIINGILINFTVEKVDLKKRSLIKILDLALEQLQVRIKEKNAVIKKDLSVKEFICNDTSLIQVFTNIIGNAIKYSKETVTIEIVSFKKDNKTYVKIRDNGIGMKKEKLPLIFDKQERIGAEGTEVKGHGIGLYNVKKMVEENNGSIEVESEIGKGSTFILIFPD
ncbi:MAG: sensor histidine kinase [Bdellovibrionota bacterium]|nr:sensor histidine kinase [Bdellovibrionota bacterium]